MAPLPALFDPGFYAEQSGLPGADADLYADFTSQGDAAGLDPSPYFDTSYYKEHYPDWQAQGAPTALVDFLTRLEAGEERVTHPLIHPGEYVELNPDVAGAGPSVLHFERHGDAEGRSPSHGFDATFYRQCYLALEQTHAFAHFVRLGQQLGHLPRPEPVGEETAAAEMRAALDGLVRPVVVVGHDAQPAGAPLLLAVLRGLVEGGWSPVVVLHRGGPLTDRFRALGRVFLLAEGWPRPGLLAGVGAEVPVLTNTVICAPDAEAAARTGHRTVALVHEMRGFAEEHGLLGACWTAAEAGATTAFAFPRVRAAYLEGAPRAATDRMTVVQPGLFASAPEPPEVEQVRGPLRAGTPGPVFIGAGYADHRKGFDLFLDAARRVTELEPAARFVWLGELSGWAQGLLDAGGAEGVDLVLPGHVANAGAWYAAADVFVLTTRQDPGPTVCLDAALTGTGFVGYASDIGIIGLADPIGEFVDPADPEGFARRLLAAARADSEMRRRERAAWLAEITPFGRYVTELEALLLSQSGGT